MIEALTMPAWGMEDAPGTVVDWLVEEGAELALGTEVVEIETTKLTGVVESPFVGTLRKIVLQKGDGAPTGALLAVVTQGDVSDAEVEAFIAQNAHADTSNEDSAPVERVVETQRGNVKVVSAGSGSKKPVVLVHGFGADSTSWSFLFSGLGRKRPVHLIDLPGHGASFKQLGDAPIDTLVDALVDVLLDIGGSVHLVGHSLGGLVAVLAAAKAPNSVASVSLLAPAGFGNAINGEFLEMFAEADSRRNARAAIEMLVSDKDSVSLAMINDVIRARRVEGAKEALHAIRGALASGGQQAIDLRPRLGSLGVPVQYIDAANDQIILPGEAPVSVVEAHTVKDAGHLLHMERAAEVQQLLEQFMERNGD